MTDSEQLEAKIAVLQTSMDRVVHLLDGNGRLGVVLQLDRLDQKSYRSNRWFWLGAGAGVTGIVAIIVTRWF